MLIIFSKGDCLAKMHSKRHGKSGKVHQKDVVPKTWMSMSKDEIVQLIVKFSRDGLMPSQIGMKLRDEYGIPSVKAVLNKRISAVLQENGVAPKIPEDLLNLIKRAVNMREHLKEHTRDVRNKVKLTHVESKIYRLSGYYKEKGVLPKNWKYVAEEAALLIK